MTDKKHDIETMAERWQRQKPVDFRRTFYGENHDDGMMDYFEQVSRVDPQFIVKLVDGGVTIFFSDASTYRMNTTRSD
jgi:hypothetical protein